MAPVRRRRNRSLPMLLLVLATTASQTPPSAAEAACPFLLEADDPLFMRVAPSAFRDLGYGVLNQASRTLTLAWTFSASAPADWSHYWAASGNLTLQGGHWHGSSGPQVWVGEDLGRGRYTLQFTTEGCTRSLTWTLESGVLLRLDISVDRAGVPAGVATAVDVGIRATTYDGRRVLPGLVVSVEEFNDYQDLFGSQNRAEATTGWDGRATVHFTWQDTGSTWPGQHALFAKTQAAGTWWYGGGSYRV